MKSNPSYSDNYTAVMSSFGQGQGGDTEKWKYTIGRWTVGAVKC